MKIAYSVICLLLSVLLLAGCTFTVNVKGDPLQTTAPATQPGDTEPAATQPVAEGVTLEELRRQLTQSQLMAAAFLGEAAEAAGAAAWAQQLCPELCLQYPFITDAEEVAGGNGGELYCIVPGDPEATVTVKKATQEGQELVYKTERYRSVDGRPILLWCSGGGFEPDTQVTVEDSRGEQMVWYPMLDDGLYLQQLMDSQYNELILDFSAYEELLSYEHSSRLASGWKQPEVRELAGNAWSWEGYLSDGRYVTYRVQFTETAANVRWNDGYDVEDHVYPDAPYTLTRQGEYAVMEIDFGEFAGKQRHNVLLQEDYGELFFMLDITAGRVESFLRRSRVMSAVRAAQPMELVGKWERSFTEVEGDVNPTDPGVCTIEIKGQSEDGLTITYKDLENPGNGYADKGLLIREESVVYDCGNDSWLAEVDHTGPRGVTYVLTIAEDGSLLLQNNFTVDGALMVGYEWFSRVQ